MAAEICQQHHFNMAEEADGGSVLKGGDYTYEVDDFLGADTIDGAVSRMIAVIGISCLDTIDSQVLRLW